MRILAPSEFERPGWRFMTSLRDAGSWIVGPDGTGHPLRRAGRLLYLDGSIMERGVFHVGTTNGLCLRLLIDTGAEMNVAGVGYIEALELMVGRGRDARGVGGHMARGLALGTMRITFQIPNAAAFRGVAAMTSARPIWRTGPGVFPGQAVSPQGPAPQKAPSAIWGRINHTTRRQNPPSGRFWFGV